MTGNKAHYSRIISEQIILYMDVLMLRSHGCEGAATLPTKGETIVSDKRRSCTSCPSRYKAIHDQKNRALPGLVKVQNQMLAMLLQQRHQNQQQVYPSALQLPWELCPLFYNHTSRFANNHLNVLYISGPTR